MGARVRADFLGAGTVKGIEVAGGASRGWTAGGEPGAWFQVGVPVSDELIAMVGVEHWENGTSPWRLSFGLQRSLIVPIPFVVGGGPSRYPTWIPPDQLGSDEVPSGQGYASPRGGGSSAKQRR